MNDSTDRRLHNAESTKAPAACIVCGSATCRGAGAHADQKLFLCVLAELLGEVTVSAEPIVIHGKTVGYMMTSARSGNGQVEFDAAFVAGDCGLEAAA